METLQIETVELLVVKVETRNCKLKLARVVAANVESETSYNCESWSLLLSLQANVVSVSTTVKVEIVK